MNNNKKSTYNGFTETRERANKKYDANFASIKLRVSFEKREEMNQHAESMGESTASFIRRAIDETMERDKKKKAKKKTEEDN